MVVDFKNLHYNKIRYDMTKYIFSQQLGNRTVALVQHTFT